VNCHTYFLQQILWQDQIKNVTPLNRICKNTKLVIVVGDLAGVA
jgi:hypothetical protein